MSAKPLSPACERNREPILAVLKVHFPDRHEVLEVGSGTGQHAVHFAAAMPWLTWQCSDRAEYLPGIRLWLEDARLANMPPPVELDVAVGPWPAPVPVPAPPVAAGGWGGGAQEWRGGDGVDGVELPRVRRRSIGARAHPPCGHLAPLPGLRGAQALLAAQASGSTALVTPQAGEGRIRFDAAFSANSLHIMGWPEVEAFFAGLDTVLADDATLVVYGPFNYGGAFSSDSNRAFDASLRARDPRMGVRDIEAVDALARAIGMRLLDDVAMPANNRCLAWRRG